MPLPVATAPLGPTQVRRGTLSHTAVQVRVRELSADTGSLLEAVTVTLCSSSVYERTVNVLLKGQGITMIRFCLGGILVYTIQFGCLLVQTLISVLIF